MYVYVYMYTYVCMYIYICISILGASLEGSDCAAL